MFTNNRRTLLALAATALLGAHTAHAQTPCAPLRVILPLGAGSGVDVIVRSAQAALSKALGGQAVVVENIAGAGEMFVDAVDAQVQHVPYKGMGPMLTDIISGQVDFGAAAVPAAQGHIASGRLKAIGVMGKQRVPALPDVPTIAEQGFPDVDVAGWFALVGPKGLPAAQVKRLHDAVVAAFNDADVKAAMAKQNNFIDPSTPEAAAAFLKTEQARYARLVAKANIKVDCAPGFRAPQTRRCAPPCVPV